MPFIPHTEEEQQAQLESIGVKSISELFDEIPKDLQINSLAEIPTGLNEMALIQLMKARAKQDGEPLCFIGAGAYEHHIPAAVWDLCSRGEYLTAYTPYQAEASQGSLQVIYEFQTMICRLTGMEAANASLYEGASALAEAALMAVRLKRKDHVRRILVPDTLHPHYREVLISILALQNIEVVTLPHHQGTLSLAHLPSTESAAALVIPQPNFFGALENVDALTDWAHQQNLLVIAVVNPTALALLTPPSEWGSAGADIVCGEGQPLGIPLASGGPYFGFLSTRLQHVRQLPGRIVGRTVDTDGKPGFSLTLQAREQHIRRGKATSNICTNQGLMVTAATIYMSLLGDVGLRQIAQQCHHNTQTLVKALCQIPGIHQTFPHAFFHECVVTLPTPVAPVLARLRQQNMLGGYDLSHAYPTLENALLVCVTETKTQQQIQDFSTALASCLTADMA